MNIYNLDLAPQTPATLWHMHPSDLCRLSDDYAHVQSGAAMEIRNPAFVLTDSDELGALQARLDLRHPVLVVYPPAGLSEHVCELALERPELDSRCASDYRSQAGFLTWTVRNVRICIPLRPLQEALTDEGPWPSHFVVAFVGRNDVAAQAVALDSEFFAGLSDCWRDMHHESANGLSSDEAWLDEHEHRGPCFLYEDNPDWARSQDDWVWVFLEYYSRV